MDRFEIAILLLMGAVLGMAGAVIVDDYIDMPDVYTSYSTGKCKGIIHNGEHLSCSRLDEFERYNNIWVE